MSADAANIAGLIANIMGAFSIQFGSINPGASLVRQKMRELGMAPITICQIGLEVGEIESTIQAADRRLSDYCVVLDSMPAYTRRKTVAQINIAMQQVAKTAAILEKVDLSEDGGLESMQEALNECEKLFDHATDIADSRLKTMSTIHAQIVEVQRINLIPLKSRLDGLKGSFEAGIRGSADNYKNAKTQSAQQQATINNLQGSINSLQDKLNDDRQTREATGILGDILTLGIYHAVTGESPDIAGLDDAIRDKENALGDAQRSHQHAQDIVMVLAYQMQQTREQAMYMLETCGRLPRMLGQIDAVLETSNQAQIQLATLKDDASALVRQTKDLKNTARNTKDLGVMRQEFVDGLTTLCSMAKLDPKLEEVIQLTLDTINPKKTIDTNKELRIMAADQKKADSKRLIGPLGIPAISRLPLPWTATRAIDEYAMGPLGVPICRRAADAA